MGQIDLLKNDSYSIGLYAKTKILKKQLRKKCNVPISRNTMNQVVCQIFVHLYHTSSSSSYRAGSTDIPDPLSPLLPIVYRPR